MQRSGLAIVISILFVASVVVALYVFARPLQSNKKIENKVEVKKDVVTLSFPLLLDLPDSGFMPSTQRVETPLSPEALTATQVQKILKDAKVALTSAEKKTLQQSFVVSGVADVPVFISVEQVLAGYQTFWKNKQEVLKKALGDQAVTLQAQAVEKLKPALTSLRTEVGHSFFDISLTRLEAFFAEVEAGKPFDSKNVVLESKEDLKEQILYCYLLTKEEGLLKSWEKTWLATAYLGGEMSKASLCLPLIKQIVGNSGSATVELTPVFVDSLWVSLKTSPLSSMQGGRVIQKDVDRVRQSLKEDIPIISSVIPSDVWLKKNTKLINESISLPVTTTSIPVVLSDVYVEPAIHVYDSISLHMHYILSDLLAGVVLDKATQYEMQKWSDVAVKLKEWSLSELQGRTTLASDKEALKAWISLQSFPAESFTDVILLFSLHNQWILGTSKMLK